MIVGIPKERKSHEYRVGLVPAGARALVEAGGKVLIEKGAGIASGITDEDFIHVGAQIMDDAVTIWKKADLIIKVKEPIEEEYDHIRPGQIIYTFLHLAVVPKLAEVLIQKNTIAIAYETIQRANGSLPLLKPMSEVAGRMAVQAGATHLQKEHDGRGVLLGGVPGVRRGRVAILGGGVVGTNACKVAVGLGADVTVIDVNVDRLEYLDDIFGSKITTLKSNSQVIEETVAQSDLVVGAVLIAGAKAPTLVTRKMIGQMTPGSVIVDVAVDQGGCVETAKPTTHEKPTYKVDGIIHYCVSNMPGAVPYTSTLALTNVTLPYAKRFVEIGVERAIRDDKELARGVNVFQGRITHRAVAQALGREYHEAF